GEGWCCGGGRALGEVCLQLIRLVCRLRRVSRLRQTCVCRHTRRTHRPHRGRTHRRHRGRTHRPHRGRTHRRHKGQELRQAAHVGEVHVHRQHRHPVTLQVL